MKGNIDRNVYGIYPIDFAVIIRNKTCQPLSRIENREYEQLASYADHSISIREEQRGTYVCTVRSKHRCRIFLVTLARVYELARIYERY